MFAKTKEQPAIKKKLYRKLRKKLRRTYAKFQKRSFRRRLKLLIAAVCGLMRTRKPYMSSLGYGLPQKITAHSQEKTMKGFLENKWIAQDTFYEPFIGEVLKEIFALKGYKEKIRLVIDGSKMGSSHMALMISLWFEGRGIPLVWIVKKKPKGHFKSKVHVDLLHEAQQLLKPYLSNNQSVVFMGDGEFDNVDLQDACKSEGWNFVFRTSCNSVFYEDESRFQPKELSVNEKQNFTFINNTEFTEEHRKKVNFVLWHEPQYEEAIPLISNLEEPIDVIEAYQKRYSIEGMFKDMKSTTFSLHKTRLTKIHSIANLILVGAIALVFIMKVGLKYHDSPLRPYVNRMRPNRTVNTFITYGRDFLKYCLDNGEKVNFSYKFSKNTS